MVQVMGILEHCIVGVVVFVTTEIDDLVVLVALYADPQLRNRAIVAGRLLGTGALTATSAVAAVAALTIPSGWTALLGFAPLVLGLRPLLRDEAGDDEAIGQEHVHAESRRTRESVYSQTLAVSSITIANGGDNLGVYIPLFASAPRVVPLYALIFAAMAVIWCLIGYGVVNNPWLGEHIRRYGHIALPFVLIGLGLYILSGALVLFH
jgi:cadmium resistance protein CadD (predicted permease)